LRARLAHGTSAVTARDGTLALSIGYIDWIAEADSERWSFLPGLIEGRVIAADVGVVLQKEGLW
jgi:hypothetical protein